MRHLGASVGRILLSAVNAPGLLADALAGCPRACVDLSRVRSPLFAVEKLCRELPADRIVFGSLHPIQTIEASLWPVLDARIDQSARRGILAGNFRRLTGEAD